MREVIWHHALLRKIKTSHLCGLVEFGPLDQILYDMLGISKVVSGLILNHSVRGKL